MAVFTVQQKLLVLSSFIPVAMNPGKVSAIFYQRVFELDPDLAPLFKDDIGAQGHKFMNLLALIVRSIDRYHVALPAIREMGRRHVKYGVSDEDYQTFKVALLATLEEALGEEFNEDIREAWSSVYDWMAATAIEAASS